VSRLECAALRAVHCVLQHLSLQHSMRMALPLFMQAQHSTHMALQHIMQLRHCTLMALQQLQQMLQMLQVQHSTLQHSTLMNVQQSRQTGGVRQASGCRFFLLLRSSLSPLRSV